MLEVPVYMELPENSNEALWLPGSLMGRSSCCPGRGWLKMNDKNCLLGWGWKVRSVRKVDLRRMLWVPRCFSVGLEVQGLSAKPSVEDCAFHESISSTTTSLIIFFEDFSFLKLKNKESFQNLGSGGGEIGRDDLLIISGCLPFGKTKFLFLQQ